MNITKISANMAPAFKAQTKINAPESLLSKDDKEYFVNLGKKYKTDKDTIDISISDLHTSSNNPDVQVYTVTRTIKEASANDFSVNNLKMTVPYIKDGVTIEKNSPKNYLTKVFDSLLSK